MPFLDLPNEIIILVARYLNPEHNINAFAKSSRRMFNLVNPYLYRYNIKHSGSSGLHNVLATEEEKIMGRFFHCEEIDLHEYYYPSEATTQEGLPVRVTRGIVARNAAIQQFKENNANFDFDDGRTALHDAAENRAEPNFWLLVKNGFDVSAIWEYEKWTMMHFAAYGGCVRILRFLIKETKLDLNARDCEEKTPLHYAALRGHEGAIRILVDNGAEIDARDEDGWTPLHRLIVEGRPAPDDWCYPAVHALLQLGADIEARIGEDGKTPLHLATMNCRDDELIEILLKHGADLEARDDAGRTPLYCSADCAEMAKFLVEHGADVNTRDDLGYSLLYTVAESDSAYEMIGYSLERVAYIDANIGNGETVMQHLKDEDKMWVVKNYLRG